MKLARPQKLKNTCNSASGLLATLQVLNGFWQNQGIQTCKYLKTGCRRDYETI